MGLFGFGKNKEVVDLGERYRKHKEKVSEIKEESEQSSSGVTPFPFFADDNTPTSTESSETEHITGAIDPSERRRRLVKRLKDMTSRIEDLSSQIYRLQQRIEVLEKKI
jgi:chromosome segregation ATPase